MEMNNRRMERRVIGMSLAVALTVSLLNGCGFHTDTAAAAKTSTSDSHTLNLLMWDGDCSEDVVKDFEKQYGVDVNITYIEDTNEILSKMINSKTDYDLIDLESGYVKSFIDAGLLTRLDASSIPNLSNIDQDTFMAKGTGPEGNEDFSYTLPISGPLFTCIVYNKKTCPITIQSFQDLADPALKGQICSVNATISLYAGALKTLGYSTVSTDNGELQDAQELLKKIKTNISSFVGSSALSQLEAGDCSVAYCWDYNYLCADSEDNWDTFDIVDSSALGYTQNWAIAKTSGRKELAEKFINFTYEPEETVKTLKEYGGVPILKKDLIEQDLPDNYYANPCVTKYTELWQDASNHAPAVSDTQISKMDDLYTQLMSS